MGIKIFCGGYSNTFVSQCIRKEYQQVFEYLREPAYLIFVETEHFLNVKQCASLYVALPKFLTRERWIEMIDRGI